jgi:membrane associated rhomboid family serine protease
MQQSNFIAQLKQQFQTGGMHIRLIFINAFVFLFIGILNVIGRLISPELATSIGGVLGDVFTLKATFFGFLSAPWGIITSIFAHFTFMHFLFNMIFLFFVGRLFEQFFSSKKLLVIYIFGGIAGGLLEIAAHELFPAIAVNASVIVGASGSIMAIFIAVAVYKPQLEVKLFGVFGVKIIILAGLYFIYDLLSIGSNDGTAHFAHLGGAIFGYFAVQNINTPKNILIRLERLWNTGEAKLKGLFRKKSPKLKVQYGGRNKSDEQFNSDKIARQQKINAILDKISKSGYESLTSKEKDMLFDESKNG